MLQRGEARKQKVTCLSCDEVFDSEEAVKQHSCTGLTTRAAPVSAEPVLCSVCGRKFSSRRLLTQHMDGMHQSKPKYSCERCGKTYRWPSPFAFHKKRCNIPLVREGTSANSTPSKTQRGESTETFKPQWSSEVISQDQQYPIPLPTFLSSRNVHPSHESAQAAAILQTTE